MSKTELITNIRKITALGSSIEQFWTMSNVRVLLSKKFLDMLEKIIYSSWKQKLERMEEMILSKENNGRNKKSLETILSFCMVF